MAPLSDELKRIIEREIESRKDSPETVTWTNLCKAITSALDVPADQLKDFKRSIKDYAAECLATQSDDESDSLDEPVASTSKAIEISDEEEAAKTSEVKAKTIKSKKRKSENKEAYKSKEFVDSQDNPFSGEVEDTAPPPKKAKKSSEGSSKATKAKSKPKEAVPTDSKPKASKKKVTDLPADEAEIERLKKFVKACGVRFMAKETADMTNKEAIKYLKKRLSDLGMSGRLSMARAEEIKNARELAKEQANLGVVNVDAETRRASRSAAVDKPKKKRFILQGDPESSDEERKLASDTSSSHASAKEAAFRRKQARLDKRHMSNANVSSIQNS